MSNSTYNLDLYKPLPPNSPPIYITGTTVFFTVNLPLDAAAKTPGKKSEGPLAPRKGESVCIKILAFCRLPQDG